MTATLIKDPTLFCAMPPEERNLYPLAVQLAIKIKHSSETHKPYGRFALKMYSRQIHGYWVHDKMRHSPNSDAIHLAFI